MTGSDNTRPMSAAHLAIELERLRRENARLRAALAVNSRYARRIQRARDAALQMALWHVGYLETSRAACTARGMAHRQWENGTALLRLGRAIDNHGRWRLHDLPGIQGAIDKAAERAAEDPAAFFLRGNKHMHPRRHTAPAGGTL